MEPDGAEGDVRGYEVGDELGDWPPLLPSPGGSISPGWSRHWLAEPRESPKGRASPLELPGPRSPPLPRIVLAPEQSQGGHLIPACGGSWLSPRPFDWAAVMRERQLGGRGRKGQPPSLTQLSPPPPPPA